MNHVVMHDDIFIRVEVTENRRFAEVAIGQVHDFLRSAPALDGRKRLGENGRATLKVADVTPSRVNGIERVVAANAALANAVRQAWDLLPINLDTRRYDEIVILNLSTITGPNTVLVWTKLRYGVADPFGAPPATVYATNSRNPAIGLAADR